MSKRRPGCFDEEILALEHDNKRYFIRGSRTWNSHNLAIRMLKMCGKAEINKGAMTGQRIISRRDEEEIARLILAARKLQEKTK